MDIRECSKQSKYAPCPVRSNETLLRLIFYPDHIRDTHLLPEAISREDLRSRGFSIQRAEYATRKILQCRVDEICTKADGRSLAGIVKIVCENIRGIKDNDACQAFIVLDDANKEDDIGHAIILFSRDYANSFQRKLRKDLLDLMTEVISIEEAVGS